MTRCKLSLFLILSTTGLLMGQEDARDPVSLSDAREVGRAKSRFLDTNGADHSDTKKAPKADLSTFKKTLQPILSNSCLACHGPERAEGRLRIDKLDANLLTGDDVLKWREVYNALGNSEMPPADEYEYALADEDRGLLVDWIGAELAKAYQVRKNSEQHSSFRRMTRYEYNYALQDLLGYRFDLVERLPPDTVSDDGFKNRSELLQMSAMQFETSREIGLKALQRVTVIGTPPEPVTYSLITQDHFNRLTSGQNPKTFNKNEDNYRQQRNTPHFLHRESGKAIHFGGGNLQPNPDAIVGQLPNELPVTLALPHARELKFNLDRFLPDEGTMRIRIHASRSNMNPQDFASLQLIFSAHTSNNANFAQVISHRDVPVTAAPGSPQIIDFFVSLGDIQRNPFRKLETTFPRRDEFLHIRNISNGNRGEDPLQILIDHIEITAPFYEQWPPQSHKDIFVESDNKDDEEVYAKEVLIRFMRRAWRRPATTEEVEQFTALFNNYRGDFSSFEEAMQEVLATVLASPDFLYIAQTGANQDSKKPKSITDWELASRLSFFLWSSIPDEELLAVAEQGKLHDTDILTAQVNRMLQDPRAVRFSEQFVSQWLGTEELENTTHINDEVLKSAMHDEPVAFFSEVLAQNGSVMDFIHSDYAVVNERLAAHYGFSDVFGPQFRRVSIDPNANRGGVLTNAGMLAMNSDGTDSHPLKRGIWMLERILHDPPPPPPPNVPEVDLTDPNILKMTLKERIEDHRNKAACRSCHAKIDPWGIAFENYDALGAFRTSHKNGPVDATSELFNKEKLNGMTGLKRYLLLERQDQFAHALAEKLTTYALGRSLAFSDNADINRIVLQLRQQEDRLGDLIHLIVQSDIFNSK